MTGAEQIAKERQRQVDDEGWTKEHDQKHSNGGSLTLAALCYAAAYMQTRCFLKTEYRDGGTTFYDPWPWEPKWDKREKHDPERCLVIAGALIAAELDRLRAAEDPNK